MDVVAAMTSGVDLLSIEAKRTREEKGKENVPEEEEPPLKKEKGEDDDVPELDNSEDIASAMFQHMSFRISPTVTSLDLEDDQIDSDDVAMLANALTNNQTLTDLNVSYHDFDPAAAIALAKALEINKTLTQLDLRNNMIGNEGAIALAKTLETNRTLTDLRLDSNQIKNEGAEKLGKALLVNHGLERLTLSYNHIGAPGAIALAEALTQNRTLVELNLFHNYIGVLGIRALLWALETNQTLLWLRISENSSGIPAGTIQNLARTFDANHRRAQIDRWNRITNQLMYLWRYQRESQISVLPYELWIDIFERLGLRRRREGELPPIPPGVRTQPIVIDKPFPLPIEVKRKRLLPVDVQPPVPTKRVAYQIMTGSAQIATAMSMNQPFRISDDITALDLSGLDVFSVQGPAHLLADALVENTTLIHLNLGANTRSNDFRAEFARVLSGNATIQRLEMAAMHLVPVDITELATALALNRGVTYLDLSNNLVSIEGSETLATALLTNKTIRSLILMNVLISRSGLTFLAAALETNQTLTELNLSYNIIEGTSDLAKMLWKNRGLRILDISHNQINQKQASNLVKVFETGGNTTLVHLTINTQYRYGGLVNVDAGFHASVRAADAARDAARASARHLLMAWRKNPDSLLGLLPLETWHQIFLNLNLPRVRPAPMVID